MLRQRDLIITLVALPAGALPGETVIDGAMAADGAQVPISADVSRAMTDTDHMTAIHLLATANPTSGIARVPFSSQGRARRGDDTHPARTGAASEGAGRTVRRDGAARGSRNRRDDGRGLDMSVPGSRPKVYATFVRTDERSRSARAEARVTVG
jgi:hypothetical protein